MTLRIASIRNVLPPLAAALAMLALYGCAGQAPAPTVEAPVAAAADTVAAELAAPPPLVPVGVDTSFVLAADSTWGAVFDRDSLAELAAETRALDMDVQAVDTLGAVTRFVNLAVTGDERWAMTPADSQLVGSLVLRGMAADDPDAARMLDLDAVLGELTTLVERADSLNTDLGWAGDDPARAAQAREVRLAVLGFSEEGGELRRELVALQQELGPASLTADSARTQQKIGELVRAFGADLDAAINVMGRAAQNVTGGTLTPEAMQGLGAALTEQRAVLADFESRWSEFGLTGSLDLSNPDKPFDPARMNGLLERMDEDLRYLAQMCANRADELAAAEGFEAELAARKSTEDTVRKTGRTLMDLKKRNRTLISAYGNLAASYWKSRLAQVADEQVEREKLYAQLEEMVGRAGGAERIRTDADLVAAYRASSDRLLTLRRRQLAKVQAHDGLRQTVQASLAVDLYNRARVLGDPDDYIAADAAYAELRIEQPGEHAWPYQMASLAWSRSTEAWESDPGQARAEAEGHLAACEQVLLDRWAYDRGMADAEAELTVAAGGTAAPADSLGAGPSARAALFRPVEMGWHYAAGIDSAAVDLARLEPAAADPDVRRWLLNVEVLRKRLAFDAGLGDAFLYRYARQVLLDEQLTAEQARPVFEHWSWDDGNIVLRQRWSAAAALDDTNAALAAVKADSLAAVLADCRTEAARRRVAWTLGALEFQQLERHDDGLQRLHDLYAAVQAAPTTDPAVGPVDSTVTAGYPVYLYNRGTLYQRDGRRQEAFYCFLGVADRYAADRRTGVLARFSAASLLADGNRKGALQLVRMAIKDALAEVAVDPGAIDLDTLIAMHELRRELAGDLGLFQEATRARDEARQLRALTDRQASAAGGAR